MNSSADTKGPKTYLTCAETAKLVRTALHARFPGVKFSVRSKTYSLGASINVGWVDGPTTTAVEKVLNLYQGASFDGMQDLKSYHDSILVDADGTMERVHFGADYVFACRSVRGGLESEGAVVERCGRDLCQLQGIAYDGPYTRGLLGKADGSDLRAHVWRVLSATTFGAGETYAGVQRVVEGNADGWQWAEITKATTRNGRG